MYKKIFSLIIISSMTLFSLIFAQGFTAQQVDAFEVSGVKIGMTEEEAFVNVIQKYNTSEDQIKLYGPYGQRDVVVGEQELNYFSYNGDGENVYVFFTLDVNQTPPVNVVSEVNYDMRYTPDNAKNVENILKQRFGDASVADSSRNLKWCQIKDKYTCKEDTTILEYNSSGSITVKVSIKNTRYRTAKTELETKQKNKNANF